MRARLLVLVLVTTLAVVTIVLAPDLPLQGRDAVAAAPAATSSTILADRNADRARVTFAAIQQQFRPDGNHFLETVPSEPSAYTTLWPLTQTVSGLLSASRLTGQPPDSLSAFAPYWDAAASPPGYSASMQPPLGSGDRKFFDDNAWTGLTL